MLGFRCGSFAVWDACAVGREFHLCHSLSESAFDEPKRAVPVGTGSIPPRGEANRGMRNGKSARKGSLFSFPHPVALRR